MFSKKILEFVRNARVIELDADNRILNHILDMNKAVHIVLQSIKAVLGTGSPEAENHTAIDEACKLPNTLYLLT